jgi:ferredoxin
VSTAIYYFSGSGNSLYVARELQKRLAGAALVPIVSLLGQSIIETTADSVGLVFPLHGMTIPIPVKRFLQKIKIHPDQYLFAIATRGGTECVAFRVIDKILKKRGKSLDAQFAINMATNDPKLREYEIPSRESFIQMESVVQKRLDAIQAVILNKLSCSQEDMPLDTLRDHFSPVMAWILEKLILFGVWYAGVSGVNDYFYADAKCNGCRRCEKVCLSGKIAIIDGRPVWQDNVKCHLCYTCLNYCPRQAVQIKSKWYMKSYTAQNGRYPHPFATAEEIMAQKADTRQTAVAQTSRSTWQTWLGTTLNNISQSLNKLQG